MRPSEDMVLLGHTGAQDFMTRMPPGFAVERGARAHGWCARGAPRRASRHEAGPQPGATSTPGTTRFQVSWGTSVSAQRAFCGWGQFRDTRGSGESCLPPRPGPSGTPVVGSGSVTPAPALPSDRCLGSLRALSFRV